MVPAPQSGYTLPVFACAAAIAAIRCLRGERPLTVAVDLLDPPQQVEIPIEQVAPLNARQALAITRSDPGQNLDLTRNTPIWALVELRPANDDAAQIEIAGGEGIGRRLDADGQSAIYTYAQRLLKENLSQYLKPEEALQVTVILPEGRSLALRTSNAAFGVVEGLSLLGTSGISQPLSAPEQLEEFRQTLRDRAQQSDTLVFCLGENGLDLAARMGIDPEKTIKTANWLGPLLVEAGELRLRSLLLFGYHGKLIKLAGGIFHTHHHLADGRLEILTTHAALAGLPTEHFQPLFASATAEAALQYLRQLDAETSGDWVARIYGAIAQQIDRRAQAYIQTHSEQTVCVGSLLFDRSRSPIVSSPQGADLLKALLQPVR